VPTTTRLIAIGFALATGSGLLVGCDAGDGEEARTTTTTTSTGQIATSVAPGTSGTATSSPCGSLDGAADLRVDYPNKMSSLVGKDVRTGRRPCSERFVIELQPSGDPANAIFPGYWVRYATGPVTLNPKGEEITLRGDAVLLASMGSWMLNTENAGYKGSTHAFPTNVTSIREYRLTEDFEGQSTWAIGLDKVRNFRVTVLDGPPRLVIDVAT
jgi:hypothetical protein